MDEVSNIARELLNRKLEPLQAYIVLKYILNIPESENLPMAEAEEKALQSKWVKELEETQEPDGSWGRFHSMDSGVKKKFPTTERAVRRALALGLHEDCAILKKATGFMSAVIRGTAAWPDRVEHFNEWPVTTRMITAATLSEVSRNHPDLQEVWRLWSELVRRAFDKGTHDPDSELAAFCELTGIVPTKRSTKLAAMYPLILLSSTDRRLPDDTEKAYLDWLWNYKAGIYYLTGFGMDILPEISSKEFPFWLRSLDLFSRYSYGKRLAQNSADYIWSLRGSDGLWDCGNGSDSAVYAKKYCGWLLADSWREPVNRKIDFTIRILLLLKRYT